MTSDASDRRPPDCGDPAALMLDFYLNGSLDPQEAEQVHRHLESCPTCAAEIDAMSGIAAAIDRFGASGERRAVPPRRAGLRSTGTALAAAAVFLLVLAAAWSWRAGREGGLHGTPKVAAGTVIDLDLAAGVLRDGSETPVVTLSADADSARAGFFPPLVEIATTRVAVFDAAGERVFGPVAMPPLDPEGRAVVVVPATALARAGRYELVLHSVDASDQPEARIAAYPFDVIRRER